MDKVQDIARMQKLMENRNKQSIGTLKKKDGTFTTNNEENIVELMTTHFPDCRRIINGQKERTSEPIYPVDNDIDKINIITDKERITEAVTSLKSFKSPGEDGIFPALLHKADKKVIDVLQNMFKCSLKFAYIPVAWRGTYVTFIPKPGKESYDVAKSFRPISLMSFLLKVLEKLIYKTVESTVLTKHPLNKAQHAYLKGHSTESALHQFISYHEKHSILGKKKSITTFIDIEGAFDNTNFDVIIKEARKRNIDTSTCNWMRSMLMSRIIKARDDEDSLEYNPTRGCPQGGCHLPFYGVL